MSTKKFLNPQNVLFLIGISIVFSCYFLPVTTSCKFTDGPEEIIETVQYGSMQMTYYLSFMFLILIYVLSLSRNTTGIIFTIIFSVLFGGVILFFNGIASAGWGNPCGHSPTNYQRLLYLGHVLIVFGCIIKSFRNRHLNRKVADSEAELDLLDSE